MAAQPTLPVEEYLRTSFEGSGPEYLDGEIVERNLGEKEHSRVQRNLIRIFCALETSKRLFCFPDLRLRVSANRYRIPDVAVFPDKEPEESVPSIPPLIAIEIVSPEDRLAQVVQKLAEYRDWGIPHVWLIEPATKKLFRYGEAGLVETAAFELPGYGVIITAEQIFG